MKKYIIRNIVEYLEYIVILIKEFYLEVKSFIVFFYLLSLLMEESYGF